MRGDDPATPNTLAASDTEFPACAGMIRHVKTERTLDEFEFPACAGMIR